jgi:hypothetical protein
MTTVCCAHGAAHRSFQVFACLRSCQQHNTPASACCDRHEKPAALQACITHIDHSTTVLCIAAGMCCATHIQYTRACSSSRYSVVCCICEQQCWQCNSGSGKLSELFDVPDRLRTAHVFHVTFQRSLSSAAAETTLCCIT